MFEMTIENCTTLAGTLKGTVAEHSVPVDASQRIVGKETVAPGVIVAQMDVSKDCKDCALLVTKLLVANGFAITKMNVREFTLLP